MTSSQTRICSYASPEGQEKIVAMLQYNSGDEVIGDWWTDVGPLSAVELCLEPEAEVFPTPHSFYLAPRPGGLAVTFYGPIGLSPYAMLVRQRVTELAERGGVVQLRVVPFTPVHSVVPTFDAYALEPSVTDISFDAPASDRRLCLVAGFDADSLMTKTLHALLESRSKNA